MGGSLGLLLVWAGVLGTALLLQAGVWFFVPTIGFGCYLAWTVFEVILNDEIEDAVRVTVLSTVSLVGGLAGSRSPAQVLDAWPMRRLRRPHSSSGRSSFSLSLQEASGWCCGDCERLGPASGGQRPATTRFRGATV